MRVALPKTKVVIPKDIPYFFFGGPVRGGDDWQYDMVKIFDQLLPESIAAIPCRYGLSHPLLQRALMGFGNYDRQLSWERPHIELAAWDHPHACLLFWLGCESKINPHPGPEPYAMDTRGEMRWVVHKKYRPETRLVIGADPKFFGLSQIQRNANEDLGYEFPIYNTMEETARAAIEVAMR